MDNSKLIELQQNQLKEIDGGWFYIMPPSGFAPMAFQILSFESFVEGYQDATEK